jgi:hypothetical protein
LLAVAALAWAGAAQAQTNPETGDISASVGGQASTSGTSTQITTTTTQTPSGGVETTTTTEAADPNADDHTAVVGTFGVGFFGVANLPLTGCDGGGCGDFSDNATVAAPTIGVRYWLNDMIGIEGALGFHFSSTDFDPTTVSQFGFALHGGVPLALAHAGHFVFEVVPQLNFGIASGSVETTVGNTSSSIDTSGFLFEVGAKGGGEIHFGFIGVPQLSLQAMLGLMIRHENRGSETPAGGGMTTEVDSSTTSISTGVDEAPWKLFTGNISAIYYF